MNSQPSIDINCDLGEGFGRWRIGDDRDLMKLITSANVACGFHASDPATMLETVESARELDVGVGAHPGLPDLLGFGRRRMDISARDGYAYAAYQIGALQAMLRTLDRPLTHVKAHGAYYDLLKEDVEIGRAFAQALCDTMETPVLFFPAPIDAGAVVTAAQAMGIRVVGEVYADLKYGPDGSIAPEHPKKLEAPAERVYDQILGFLQHGAITTTEGRVIELEAETISIHGDGPNVMEVLDSVHRAIRDAGYLASRFTL